MGKQAEWITNLIGIPPAPPVYANFHRDFTLTNGFGILCSKKVELNTGECPDLYLMKNDFKSRPFTNFSRHSNPTIPRRNLISMWKPIVIGMVWSQGKNKFVESPEGLTYMHILSCQPLRFKIE
ncbi:hypothetical protein AVEN_30167-1 [Araneus ventricosus]|uniref:Uncharacterized protein n=1 Tax=Araneus ventricosus TaxID=182803 RepID=A0A4Y2PF95_ARAVE|nr:hypothetical protein AVEN_10930-1 [Araneus ventricosus]GBN48710.1 hypothetical protein AVEN_30167-1 [Araneus ventricosus]